MKRCSKCGTIHDNSKFFCIDCYSSLGAPLSEEEEAEVNDKIKETITNLSNRADYFYVSKTDKIMIYLLCISSALHALLMLIRAEFYRENHLFPLGVCLILLAIATCIDLRFPRMSWELFKLRFALSIENPDDMEPSGFMLWFRRFTSKIILAVLVVAFIIFLILS
jgi:hypothetical protein